jgi:hypothetical protein
MENYFIKVSVTLSNKDTAVLKKALKDFILVTSDHSNDKKVAKDLLELIENVDKRVRRQNASE